MWVELFVKVKILLFFIMKIFFLGIFVLIVKLVWIFCMWYLLCMGMKYFGLIKCNINFCFCWLLWLEVWILLILLWIILILVFWMVLINLLIFVVLLGIGFDEKIIVLLGCKVIWWWVLLVIWVSVVIDLFWLFVYIIKILLVWRCLSLFGLMKVFFGILI